MGSYLQVSWINHFKGIIHGSYQGNTVQKQLTTQQCQKIWTLNQVHRDELQDLLESMLDEKPA